MATKSMGYDHPTYINVIRQPVLDATGKSLVGSATASARYAAFTNMLIKNIWLAPFTTATAADQWYVYRITNNGTTAVNTVTATYTIGTIGSGIQNGTSLINAVPTVSTSGTMGTNPQLVGSAIALLPGDIWYTVKGADTAGTFAADAELQIAPLSNVTA